MAFNVPISSRPPLPSPPDWVRPSDWIVITDTPNEVQFLVADTGTKAFTIQTSFTRTSGNIYIDWGDGVINTITTTGSTNTNHVYSTGGTPCSRGYNTFKIRIYGDATCVITNARHIPNFAVTGGNPYYNIGLLEAYFGDGTCGTSAFLSNYFTSNTLNIGYGNFQLLEYVKLPATVSWTNQLSSMFQGCANLYVIIMPTSASSLSDLTTAFSTCPNLLDIILPSNATAITGFNTTFSNSTKLRSVTFPTSLNNCTTFTNSFTNCPSIKNITIPSVNICTNFQNAFSGCASLQWIRFISLPAPAVANTPVTFNNSMSSNPNLQNVYFPDTCSSNAIYNFSVAFQSCGSLKNFVFPVNFKASTIASSFSGCGSITSIVFQSSMPDLTTMQQAFNGCNLLSSITLPTSVSSSGINMQQSFSNCFSLKSITIPSGWLITNLNSTFNGCNGATSITLPNNAQNSIATMDSAFSSCNKLETLVLPTSLNSVTNLLTTFANCLRLTSVTLPATMNLVTTMASCFQNCTSLTSITLPTSMTACTNFQSTFGACYAIENITMPTNVSPSVTTYQALTQSCVNLKTLTLPITQTSSVTTIANMITSCGNLTTINNLDKVGSLTATPLVLGTMASGTAAWMNVITSLSFSCPFSALTLNGSTTLTNFNKLNSLRLLNASAGQYTGSSPQINVSYCDLGITALNQLFTDLPTVTAKTINITGCTGAAGCTRSIATAKGWTVTG